MFTTIAVIGFMFSIPVFTFFAMRWIDRNIYGEK